MRSGLAVVVLSLSACVQPDSVTCASGITCPPNNTCDDVHMRCLAPEQVAECGGKPDGTSCMFSGADGSCQAGVCELFVCGNGIQETGEECDGVDLGDDDCTTFHFYDAPGLACNDDCTFDTRGCTGACGDGTKNGGEQCDGSDLALAQPGSAMADCIDAGYYKPAGLACSPFCRWDTSACQEFCGDQVKNGEELCDGAPPTETCYAIGFDAGDLTCSNACGFDLDSCARFGWHRDTAPSGSWTSIHGSSATNVWIGGNAGTTLHYNGTTWIAGTTTLGQTLEHLWVIAPDDVWAIAGGTVEHYNGSVWTQDTTARSDISALWASAGNDVWTVGSANTQVERWNGTAWVSGGTTGIANPSLIHGSSASNVWVMNQAGRAAQWNGTAWQQHDIDPTDQLIHDLFVRAPDDVWAVGSTGDPTDPIVAHWNGIKWSISTVGRFEGAHVYANAPNDVWIGDVIAGGVHWDGRRWESYSGFLADIYFAGPAQGFAIDGLQHSLRYRGQIYSSSQYPGGGSPRRVFTTPDGHTFITEMGGSMTGTVDHHDGVSWLGTESAGSGLVQAIWGASGSDVWGAIGSQLVHYDGDKWLDVPIANTKGLVAMWGMSDSDIWAAGSDETVFHYNGNGWSSRTPPTAAALDTITELSGTGPNDVWALSSSGRLFHWTGTWTLYQLTEPADSLVAVAPNQVMVMIGNTRSSLLGNGTTWTEYPYPDDLETSVVARVGMVAPDELFGDAGNATLHFNGTHWSLVRHSTPIDSSFAFAVTNRGFYEVHEGVLYHLIRTAPWNCRTTETDCDDGTDNDCDGKLDSLDDECP